MVQAGDVNLLHEYNTIREKNTTALFVVNKVIGLKSKGREN
jgi:hypothetical protein